MYLRDAQATDLRERLVVRWVVISTTYPLSLLEGCQYPVYCGEALSRHESAMDETTKASIEKITIRFERPTRLPGGQIASVFYDCYQLAPSELARLAAEAIGDLDHDMFDVAVGLAYSGILFAAAVAGGRNVAILQKDGRLFGPDLKGHRVVIVDDVVHTGRHLLDAAKKVEEEGGTVVGFVCIIDRSSGILKGSASPLKAPLWSAFESEMG